MMEELLKKIIRASIRAFPIDPKRKTALLKRILEDTRK